MCTDTRVPIIQQEQVPDETSWNLLLDFDCLDRLNNNKPCDSPLNIAVFSNFDNYHEHINVIFNMSRNTSHDFTTFTPTVTNELVHIVVNFKLWHLQRIRLTNNVTVMSALPNDDFMLKWTKSRYLECGGSGVKDRLARDSKRILPLSVVKDVMAPYREFCGKLNKTVYLTGGTLLGWYRECSIIPHTTDIDFGMPIADYSPEFIDQLDKEYEMYWTLGNGKSSMELSFHVGNVKTDVFFMFGRNKTHGYYSGMKIPRKRELMWIYPKVKEVCAGNLLGHLMYVPCNVEDMLIADYGPEWMLDFPTRKYVYDRSGSNIIPGKRFSASEWKKVYRPMRGFKRH
ncbi:unnamed protein product [Bursaphelenchus okinawaensis]|uniref:LicD/FKTN/FKRP nucleotidyltransferase domain-containing protein n=1 Tax=Bursaphelenchus okinawaensis TaxID=465554 RepID=A0A811KKQ9_9BILA|nr:unnamed protein product [Bursaphelenchus okinawaensis]CAG9106667.1 unnamed protein product [Bursaphelenchus okinawaensis]